MDLVLRGPLKLGKACLVSLVVCYLRHRLAAVNSMSARDSESVSVRRGKQI